MPYFVYFEANNRAYVKFGDSTSYRTLEQREAAYRVHNPVVNFIPLPHHANVAFQNGDVRWGIAAGREIARKRGITACRGTKEWYECSPDFLRRLRGKVDEAVRTMDGHSFILAENLDALATKDTAETPERTAVLHHRNWSAGQKACLREEGLSTSNINKTFLDTAKDILKNN
ncbi:hypothetical protein PROFUN_15268 [Planoprotostelium fungivorum]|uniref:Uncharacterized protein n=1 Tax=Planoprotostelium fungivorum TaxID=1890364 RepID=A0A2P6MXA4_9EUKA|nr:hypothetical protein PROFUN_15268 [Planoprotostelium fungivorum]